MSSYITNYICKTENVIAYVIAHFHIAPIWHAHCRWTGFQSNPSMPQEFGSITFAKKIYYVLTIWICTKEKGIFFRIGLVPQLIFCSFGVGGCSLIQNELILMWEPMGFYLFVLDDVTASATCHPAHCTANEYSMRIIHYSLLCIMSMEYSLDFTDTFHIHIRITGL